MLFVGLSRGIIDMGTSRRTSGHVELNPDEVGPHDPPAREGMGDETANWDSNLQPINLDGVLGQAKTVARLRRLVASLNRNEPPTSVWFFVGPVGTGKTSTAYVVAYELNNKQPYEWNCGTGGDAKTGRELLELLTSFATHGGDWGTFNASMSGEHPVFIIDEFDHYSKDARIKMRRPLELAGSRRLIIITANKEIGDTGLASRSMRFDFHELDEEASRALALRACATRNIRLSEAALRWVVKESKGDGRQIQQNVQLVDPDLIEPEAKTPALVPRMERPKGGRPTKEVDVARARQLVETLGWKKAARSMGVSESTLRKRIRSRPDITSIIVETPHGN